MGTEVSRCPAVRVMTGAFAALAFAMLAACSSTKDGAYYQNDGPGSRSASEFVNAPDAQPRDEPIVKASTRPYVVFGRQYSPLKQRQPLTQSGEASWYGKQFQGRPTSIGEKYDMYSMTAAHPTLPLPSYVRVTNKANGRTAVVRVNDRGPFLNNRIIDLSFAAAAKLGYTEQGVADVDIEVVDPMVMTLRALLARRGLGKPAAVTPQAPVAKISSKVTTVASARTAPPLAGQSAGTLARLSGAAGVALTTAAPKRVNAPDAAALARKRRQERAAEVAREASARRNAEAAAKAQAAAKAEAAKARRAQAEPARPLKLAARDQRRVTGVTAAPARQPRAARPAAVGALPEIIVEPFKGKGVRPARAERYKVPRSAPPSTGALSLKKDEPFVIPYRDRLPAKPKGGEPAPRVYLQLGAYDTEKAAREALTQAGSGLRWLRQPVSLFNDRGLHKLQAGPFASSRKARAAARRIRSESRFSPFYVFR